MKIIKKTKEELIFATEMSESLANAIRRSVLEIPVLAIDEVEFYKNDSVLYDEVLALRLGLLPLEIEKLKLQEECNCEGKGCSKCVIQLKLNAKGPGIIYAKALKGSAKPFYPEMPLVYLTEDQELELVAFARLGKGIEHTKFSPGLVYYRRVPEIEGNKKNQEAIKKYPAGLLKFEDNEVKFVDKYGCSYYDTNKEQDFRIVPGKEMVFCVESWGQMPAKDIFLEAINALRENLEEFEKSLK
jgi:DNA-directed RNA polymerase subunit D